MTLLRKQRCTVTIGDIMRDPLHRERSLACVPLVLARHQANVVMPDPSQALSERDDVLFCGTRHAERQVGATLNNEYTLQYLVSGVQESRGYIMKWLARRAA